MENSGYYEIPFTGILMSPRYVHDNTQKWIQISAIGMSSLMTQNSRLNHPNLFDPGDDFTVGKAIVQAATQYANIYGIPLSDILDDDPSVIEADFPMPLAFWWMSNENLWNVFQRAVATQGPPATFWETGLGKVKFWSGRRSRAPGVMVGGPEPGSIAFEPRIEGPIQITDHIADVVNDAAIVVQTKRSQTCLLYTSPSPRDS